MPDRVLRNVQLVGATGEIRTGTYSGREFMVVPVVALMEGVVQPMGAESPEFVPIDVLSVAPQGWNGRPVVMDHPTRDGAAVSANDPRVLEQYALGHVFNARIEDDRLKLEAWIDPDLAQSGEALDTLQRLQSGEMVEVSVGAFVVAEKRPGIAGGDRYGSVWREIVPDHLAMLPEGSIGACSIEMGCGAPRAAMRVTAEGWERMRAAVRETPRRPEYTGTESTEWSAPAFADYVDALHSGDDPPATVADASAELKRAIAETSLLGEAGADTFEELVFFPVVSPDTGNLNENALRAVISGRGSQADIPEDTLQAAQDVARGLLNSEFDADLEAAKETRMDDTSGGDRGPSVMERIRKALGFRVAITDNELRGQLWNALHDTEAGFEGIEAVDPDAGFVIYAVSREDEFMAFRRSFTVNDDDVQLADDAEQVRPQTEWVAAREETDTDTDGDEPSGHCECGGRQAAETPDEGGPDMATSERIDALISNEDSPFTEAHKGFLEGLSEEELEKFETSPAEEEPEQPETEPELEQPEEPDQDSVTLSRDELADLRAAAGAYKRQQAERKRELISGLKGAQAEYSEEELSDMDVDQLTKLSRLAGVDDEPDYSGRGYPGASEADDIAALKAPDPWKLNSEEAH